MKRFSALLLVLVMLLTLAACANKTNPPPVLNWNGHGLEGAQFFERQMGGVTVHYAGATTPSAAESIGTAAVVEVAKQRQYGHLMESDMLHVWVVPAGMAWPARLAAPPPGRRARAGAPLVIVIAEGADTAAAGLPEALALAATQPAAGPAFTVDWLHEGMGAALAGDPANFPSAPFRTAHAAVRQAEEMLKLLEAPSQDGGAPYRNAALALATLVMDRWGVAWTAQYPRQAADLSPAKALLWATGASSPTAAVALWEQRMAKVSTYQDGNAPAMADLSPMRVQPALAGLPAGPGPNDNYSPQSYEIRARYEPERRTVTGDETLTWQNGEAIAVDTLYFNLYPNAEQYAKYGGAMTVSGVTVNGRAAAYRAQGLDLTVPLGRPVPAGDSVQVRIQFTTRLPGRITSRVLGQSADGRFNLAHWFPILAVLDDRGWNLHAMPDFPGEPYSENAQFHVNLDVPENTVLVATGHQRTRVAENGRWFYDYAAPNVKDFVVAGGTKLAEEVRQVGGVTIHVLDANPDAARKVGEETERALNLFTAQYGPYAYQDLAVVTCCAWLEYPQLFYTESPASPQGNWWHTVLYHELSHQWFFGMVGNDQYAEAWLDEGFARYSERYALRAFGFTDQIRDYSKAAIPPQVHVNSSTLEFNIYGGYTAAVYNLGAVLLEDLEQLLGPDQFRELMHRYTEAYRFKTATTADFVRMAGQVAGRDLSDFFRGHQIDLSAREAYRPVVPLGAVWPG